MKPEKIITNILSQTIDPLLGLSLSDLPIKPLITLEQNQLSLNLCAGFPTHFLQDTLLATVQTALQQALPDYEIQVTLDQFIKAHRTQLPGKGLRGVKNTIAIASGKGGVGKSTVAVNLAIALARAGARVGILDADIYGPSIPLMLGKAPAVQVQGEHYLPVIAHGVQAMSIGYLTEGEPALIWRGPMLAKSLLQMLDITQWDELDYLFIDLPPGTGDIQLSLVQKIPLSGAVIVTTPQTVATLDAQKAMKMFEKTNIDVLGIIENMALHICSRCHHQEHIFGAGGAQKLCEQHHCKFLGQLPLDSRIGLDCDQGAPTAAANRDELSKVFVKTALLTAIELARKPLNYADVFPPIVVE
ncbi:iron-sulfur cluster carrier protein ApbC [Legionella septentrionalis]|uniref:iron-sulfur cluster carrier protein ApbC n=1 Tax=Legionella septentrionalis TaxID=2498109 RepID=UPI000F8D6137|nr:iron-sulfur cluster carrier protein ApbC [Legionella septentrionalis]RUR10920.1 iron-sulfur cluster carrier protein ApbC [Legionella septentrionalis]